MPTEFFPNASWLSGCCRTCGYPVVVTQGRELDYRWYCSNPDCVRHHAKEDTGDMEWPDWVSSREECKEGGPCGREAERDPCRTAPVRVARA